METVASSTWRERGMMTNDACIKLDEIYQFSCLLLQLSANFKWNWSYHLQHLFIEEGGHQMWRGFNGISWIKPNFDVQIVAHFMIFRNRSCFFYDLSCTLAKYFTNHLNDHQKFKLLERQFTFPSPFFVFRNIYNVYHVSSGLHPGSVNQNILSEAHHLDIWLFALVIKTDSWGGRVFIHLFTSCLKERSMDSLSCLSDVSRVPR